MQEQSLLYFYMTSMLQRVGYHGNILQFVNLKYLNNAHYEQGGYIIWVLIIKIAEHLGRQKLWQISVGIIYIYKSKHQEMNINTMLQPESINI